MSKTGDRRHGKCGHTLFLVSGNCMAPLIREGDVVVTVPVSDLELGDILAVSAPSPVVHRLLKFTDDGHFQTKADTAWTLDPPAAREDIRGKVVAVIRGKSRPVVMEGLLWRLANCSIARYSLFCLRVSATMPANKSMNWFQTRLSALSIKGIRVALQIVAGLAGNRGGQC